MDNGIRDCKYRRKCGACQTLNLSYEEELSLKMKRVIELLGKFGHVEGIIPSDPSEHYRNKAQYLFRFSRGRIESGLYRSSDGGIANVDCCLMEDPDISAVYARVRKLVQKHGVKAYDGRKGDLRHVMIRKGVSTGEISVALVTHRGPFEGARELAEELMRHIPSVVTVSVVKNETDVALMMNGEETVLAGPGYINDVLCGCRLKVPLKAFYQINPYSTEKLYETAAEFADISGYDHVLDAYCGIGPVGIIAAKNGCASLDGFDISPEAVAMAKINAETNGIGNSDYRCVPDSRYVLSRGKRYDTVLTDPPRAGCDRRFIANMLELCPGRIVYISCNPQTLARDLGALKKEYRIAKMQPVDMFPGTTHIETIVLLQRQNS